MPKLRMHFSAWFAVALCASVSAQAAAHRPLTLAEAETLADSELINRVLETVKSSPALQAPNLPGPQHVVRIVRPSGEGRFTPPVLNQVIRGFHDVTLHLRGRDTAVNGMCAFDQVDITFRPVLPSELIPGSIGWGLPQVTMTEADYLSLGLKVPEDFKPMYQVPADPNVEASSVNWTTVFAPVKARQACGEVPRASVQTVHAPSPEVAALGLSLFRDMKRLSPDRRDVCSRETHSEVKRHCLGYYRHATATQIAAITPCSAEEASVESCIAIQSRDLDPATMVIKDWRALITYSAGRNPRAVRVRFEQGGAVI